MAGSARALPEPSLTLRVKIRSFERFLRRALTDASGLDCCAQALVRLAYRSLARKVSPWLMSPVSKPRRNHRKRCSEVP